MGSEKSNKATMFPIIQTSEIDDIFPPSSELALRNLTTLHNKLLDVYEAIEKQCELPLDFHDVDPSWRRISPSCSLISTAVDWLIGQMEMIQKCVVHSKDSIPPSF